MGCSSFIYLDFNKITKGPRCGAFGTLILYLITCSMQILEVGTAWEQGCMFSVWCVASVWC